MVTLPSLKLRGGQSEIANVLKLNGADENIKNNAGESARKLPQIKELLAASTAGDGDTITKLLQEEVSVLSEQSNGNTGLHLSAGEGHDDIVNLFLNHNADVNIRGWNNNTPLMCAAERGHLSTAQLLIDRGAELELWSSVTPMMKLF